MVVAVAVALMTPFPLLAAGKAVPCHWTNLLCECTDYGPTAGYTEVRCPTGPPVGWVAKPPRPPVPPNKGSQRGDGKKKPEQIPAPYQNVLAGRDSELLTIARDLASIKLRRVLIDPGPPHLYGDTTCSALFDESPLGQTGAQLLASYVRFRYAPSGTPECAADWAFVRRNQDHDRYIILCRLFFDTAENNPDFAANVLIHELLHVGGQQEDGTISAGPPDDYPTTTQLREVVNSACSPPVDLF